MPEDDKILGISYEDKEVLSSGSLITFGSGPTTLALNFGGDHLRVIMEFSGDETSYEKQKIDAKVEGPDAVRLHFINYNNPLGTFTGEPHRLGTVAGREVWLTYFIAGLQGSKSKHLTYTFFIGPEAARAEN